MKRAREDEDEEFPLVNKDDVDIKVNKLFVKYPCLDAILDKDDIPIFRGTKTKAVVTADMRVMMGDTPHVIPEKIKRVKQVCEAFHEGFDFWKKNVPKFFQQKISITSITDDKVHFEVDDDLDLKIVLEARNNARATLTPERLEVVMLNFLQFFGEIWKRETFFPIRTRDIAITRDDRVRFKPFCYYGKERPVAELVDEILRKVLDTFDRDTDQHLRETLIEEIRIY